MHGGLSPELDFVDQLSQLTRESVIPEQGMLCDLLWSDPDPEIDNWERNERGISFTFGKTVLERFL
jgi:serine/threonine-protein phosphatase PP1 catalytic subunit